MDYLKPKITVEIASQVDDELRDVMLAIDEEAFGPGSLNEWSLPPFLHYGRVFLARFDGKPVGIAELMRDWRDPELAYLYGYAVMREFRGNGIGTVLLRTIFESLPRAGFRRIQLTVHPENQMAMHIYENKFGMRRAQFVPNYYGSGEDRWLMEWSTEEYE